MQNASGDYKKLQHHFFRLLFGIGMTRLAFFPKTQHRR
jgi:hypothetical protein